MSEAVHLFALQIALIAIVLVLHTYIGLHIIRRTLIFSDVVLDQLAAFGALLGVAAGVSYGSPMSYVWALGAVLTGSFLLAVLDPKRLDNVPIAALRMRCGHLQVVSTNEMVQVFDDNPPTTRPQDHPCP